MAPTRKVEVAIVGDASSMVRAFRQADGAAGRFGKSGSKLGSIGMGMLAGATAGATIAIGQGLVSAFQTGIREFSEAQKMSAQTAAAIKSTGGAAGVTVQHIESLASALQKQTGLQDDAIQGAQNLLLTFTRINNRGPDKIFDRAIRATMDLSVALGKDMGSSAIMVGKALNDPIRGVTALGRAGVQFTASQKETIKSLIETGRTADAQKMILKELETQVGGSARAFGETTPGQVEKAKRAFEDLTQGVVAAVVPLAAAVLPGLTAAINGTTSFFQANWPKIQEVAQQVWTWFSTYLLPTFQSIGQSIGSIVVSIVGIFRQYWPQIQSVITPIVTSFGGIVKSTFQTIAGVLRLVSSILRGDFKGAWESIKNIGSSIVQGIISFIKGIPVALYNAATGLLKAAFDLGKQVVQFIARGIGSLPGLIKSAVSNLLGIAGDPGAINPVVNALKGQGGRLPDAVAAGITGGQGKVTKGVNTMLTGATSQARSGAGAKAQPVGTALSSGIATGVRSGSPEVDAAISQVIRQGIEQAKRDAGIKSPSELTARKLGGPLAEGIKAGMDKKKGVVAVSLVAVMRNAIASAKANTLSLATGFASLFAQALGKPKNDRLSGLESAFAKEQSDRQKTQLEGAITAAEAEENAKRAALSTAEDAVAAQKELDDAMRATADAKTALSDFNKQKEIDNLRAEVEADRTANEDKINNLAARFAQGKISAEQFRTDLDALVGGEAGQSLGDAFAVQFSMALEALRKQLAQFSGIKGVEGVAPAAGQPERPRDAYDTDVANVRRSLEAQWEKKGEKWKKDHAKGKWVADKLEAWKRANKAKYGLAKGGIVMGPTNAIVGEAGREAVLPLEGPRARKMLRTTGIGGTSVNLTFNGVLDAREAARVLQPELNRLVQAAY